MQVFATTTKLYELYDTDILKKTLAYLCLKSADLPSLFVSVYFLAALRSIFGHRLPAALNIERKIALICFTSFFDLWNCNYFVVCYGNYF